MIEPWAWNQLRRLKRLAGDLLPREFGTKRLPGNFLMFLTIIRTSASRG